MKAINKALIITGFAWISFLLIMTIPAFRDSVINFYSLAIMISLMASICILVFAKTTPPTPQTTSPDKTVTQGDYLSWLAQYDKLTSLPTHVFFNETLNKAISHAKRHNKFLAILFIDIDNFKKINTAYNPEMGDEIIKALSERLKKCLRTEDLLARLDGDEFIILLNDINKPKFASAVAEKILKASHEPLIINRQTIKLTTSIGICIYPTDGTSLESLMKNANTALQKAQLAKGGIYKFYAQEMDEEAHEYIQLESALRSAINNDELMLYYQPKMHIKKGQIAGVEALLRWNHPKLGLISPAKFIAVAEETGQIMEIGKWVLTQACKTNMYWQAEGYEHFFISINLSPKQFHHPDITQVIKDALNETGLNPKYLEIEITETTVMENAENAIAILNKIKEIGVHISIDHFGTGYTSISHLKQFPISSIKIDHSFIKGIPNQQDDSAIAVAVIALAHHLGFEVVAEGVETAEQVQFLANQNCDMVQGYFLSHPLPAEKIVLQFRKLTDEAIF